MSPRPPLPLPLLQTVRPEKERHSVVDQVAARLAHELVAAERYDQSHQQSSRTILTCCFLQNKTEATGEAITNGPTNVPAQADTLTGTTQEALTTDAPAAATTEKPARKPRAPRGEPKQRGPPEDGVPSKTKIMVANLPFDLREDKVSCHELSSLFDFANVHQLLELFAAYEPTSAKLALRPIPRFMIKKLQARNEPRKGRGFAFVSFPSEELQQKAIAEMNGKEIDGREFAVKVAIDSPGKEDDALDAQADAEAGKENGYPSTAEGSANTNATVEAS